MERRGPSLQLKINVTASFNQQLPSDGLMPMCGREKDRRAPTRVLVVDEGLRALCRQQRANLCFVTNKRGLAKLQPRHSFPAPSLCSLRLFTCTVYGPSVRPTHE